MTALAASSAGARRGLPGLFALHPSRTIGVVSYLAWPEAEAVLVRGKRLPPGNSRVLAVLRLTSPRLAAAALPSTGATDPR